MTHCERETTSYLIRICQTKGPRVHKKGHLKVHKAEARERITYTQNLYAYAFRLGGHPRFSYLVIDAND